MGSAIRTFTNQKLEPFIYPQDARTHNVKFGNSLTIAKGTLVGAITATGLWGAYNNALSNGLEVARGIAMFDFKTTSAGKVQLISGSDVPEWLENFELTPIYIKGYFRVGDLTCLDAAAVVDLGKMIQLAATDAEGILAIT